MRSGVPPCRVRTQARVGQPDGGEVLTGSSLELMGGFWSFQERDPSAVTLHSLGTERMFDGMGVAVGVIVCLSVRKYSLP